MRHNTTLRECVARHLADFEPVKADAPKRATVALIITPAGQDVATQAYSLKPYDTRDAALLLTRRSATLKRHAGQWAFPGGRNDAGETAFDTAQRESMEEIGLHLGRQQLLGQLDDYVTRSGYVMTPLVFWVDDTFSLALNTEEVASVHRIPVREFLRDDAPMLDHNELDDVAADRTTATPGSVPDKPRGPVLRMPIGESWIAAPTAALLYQFREVCLLNHSTRVSHFEQPRFAWK